LDSGRGEQTLVEATQRFLEQRLVRLQLVGETIARRGEAALAERFVDEAGEIVRERALVAVAQCVDGGVVDRLDRVAVQLLEAGARALFPRLLLDRRDLLRALLADDGLELVR